MDLDEALRATEPEPHLPSRRPEHASGYEWDGNAGFIQTGPLVERPKTWDALIRDALPDENPEDIEVIEPVTVKGWDVTQKLKDGSNSTVRQHGYRLNIRRRVLKRDLDDLIKGIKGRRTTKPTGDARSDAAYLVALGDLQLGKMDGDGVDGTVERFLDKTQAAVDRYKRVAKGSPIYLIHLGDCIEGFVSQGGANTWRTTLTLTEQVRLYRKLLQEQVLAFAAIAPRVVVCGVPGNHDEANRPLHTYGDSWAIDALAAVRESLELAGRYDHVTMHAPARDELTLTLDVCGTIVGMAHGHQFRSGNYRLWWDRQSHSRQPVGDADMLLAGHLHHLRIEREARTFIQVPSLESESTWYRHTNGGMSQPGIVTAIVGGGSWSSLEVL